MKGMEVVGKPSVQFFPMTTTPSKLCSHMNAA